MSSSVIIDIIDSSRARLSATGWEHTRIAHVRGLEVDGMSLLIAAAITTGIPAIGTVHPTVPFLFLEEIVPEALDAGQVRLQLVYRSPDGASPTDGNSTGEEASIEVGTTLQQVETYEDANGDLLSVPYSDHDPQVKPVSVLRPQETKTFTWSRRSDPSDLSEVFVGKVNSKSWRFDPGCFAGTWLCTGITGRAKGRTGPYTVTATFQKNTAPPTKNWDETLAWVDPTTNRPPDGISDGDGMMTFRVYDSIDFNTLPIHV